MQHWGAVHDGAVTAAVIAVDAPMVAFGDVVRGEWPAEFAPKSATVFSWLMSNYWSTNFVSSQGGEFTFRYAFVSGAKFEPAQLTRSGWAQMTPLESDVVSASLRPSPVHSASFLTLDNANVVLSTWKRAEDGNGSILRFTEIAGQPQTLHLSTPHLQLDKVWKCSLLEECTQELPVRDGGVAIEMKPFEILTLRLETQPEKQR